MKRSGNLRSGLGVLVLCLLLGPGLGGARPVPGAGLVFAPPDNLPRGEKPGLGPDFPQLFSEPVEWQSAWSHLSRFSINTFTAVRASEQQLRDIAAFLTGRGIALTVTLQPLPVENCGRGIEGMTQTPTMPVWIARRMKKLDAPVSYFSLDEPLTFGHFYDKKEACRFPIEEVARRLATTIRRVREVYPDARIDDFEVPTLAPLDEWRRDLNQWLEAYRKYTGTPLDAMTLDVNWHRHDWQQVVRESVKILHIHGAKAGIFLDAIGGPGVTDESWMAEAKRNGEAIKNGDFGLDYVTVSSWMGHPRKLLPASDPMTLTGLLAWYASFR